MIKVKIHVSWFVRILKDIHMKIKKKRFSHLETIKEVARRRKYNFYTLLLNEGCYAMISNDAMTICTTGFKIYDIIQ